MKTLSSLRRPYPANLFRELLAAYPHGAKVEAEYEERWSMPRGRGLALHVAAANKASLGVVAALLEAFPEGAKRPDKDERGQDARLALEYAVEKHAPGDVQTLLAKCPRAARSAPAWCVP